MAEVEEEMEEEVMANTCERHGCGVGSWHRMMWILGTTSYRDTPEKSAMMEGAMEEGGMAHENTRGLHCHQGGSPSPGMDCRRQEGRRREHVQWRENHRSTLKRNRLWATWMVEEVREEEEVRMARMGARW